MTALHWLEDSGGVMRDVTGRVRSFSWGASEMAEEGAVASWSVVLSDPAMDLAPGPGRRYIVEETASALADHILWWGWTAEREVSRGDGDSGEYTGRAWTVSLVSADSVWERRIMTGADCRRPGETDTARMQWLLSTSEASLIDDVTTWVSTASPVAMDACDYRGQSFGSVADDCAQHSGKNWHAWAAGTAASAVVCAWYGRDTLASRDSALYLTNVQSDMDEAAIAAGTAAVWPIGADTSLRLDPSRTYDGCYLPYDGGAVFRAAARTVYRDFAAPSLNVKSSAKAAARAARYLADMAAEEERITTSVVLPAAMATRIRAGMRVPFRASHLPGYEGGAWTRVLSCSPSPVPGGYRLGLELEGSEAAAGTGADWGPYTAAAGAFGGLLKAVAHGAANDIVFESTGDSPQAGWYAEPSVSGYLEPVGSGVAYTGLRCLRRMTVRIEMVAKGAVVVDAAATTLSVTVNGYEVGSHVLTHSGGLDYWPTTFVVDVAGVELFAGDIVQWHWTGTDPGWSPGTPNDTYIRVGRGTHVWNTGTVTWTGA